MGHLDSFDYIPSEYLLNTKMRGAWVAQSVKCLTLAHVMISRFMSLSPVLGSEPGAASDSVSPPPAPPLLVLCLSLFQKYINIKKIQR